MSTLRFAEARQCVIREVCATRVAPSVETVPLSEAAGRVLAKEVAADRDSPPADRSVRDGFAFQSAGTPGRLLLIGEVRAGDSFSGQVGPGDAVEIMTGAPVPAGADAVIMIEHTERDGNFVVIPRTVQAGEAINPRGSESRQGQVLLKPGHYLGFAEIALLATVGLPCVEVYRRPQVAILATGDEIVEVGETPLPHQVRNSNSMALAAQVTRAGGIPVLLPVARDNYPSTRELVERGLQADLLLLSGGVSAGKYDIVEKVLAEAGATFYFDRVRIQPGQPLVFGRARDKFFFGLPGNPASTMVTFEVFARAAVELLAGRDAVALPMLTARLTTVFRQKLGLVRFLPAVLSAGGDEVTPLPWQGSSDVPALARANALLVTEEDREVWTAGEPIRVLLK